MRCWAYVDGFNFYNGAARRTGRKWVDLKALCERLRPADTVERIKFFTALVEKRTDDPDQRTRQRVYWRALDTLPGLERIEGQFRSRPRHLPLVESVETLETIQRRGGNVTGVRPVMMHVLRSEEKGTDVNLAAHLVYDALQTAATDTFEVALVLSADSDLAGAIHLVTGGSHPKPVFVCKPNPNAKTTALARAATGVFDLKTRDLQASLFPNTLQDSMGLITKPPSW